jgi:UDP:flavonoid glycosyltransferase YjiC (YdhE family)
MRALLTVQPGMGHLHSMLPVAWALKNRQHEVAFASAPSFCRQLEARGFQAIPAGLDWLESEAERYFPRLRELGPEERHFWFLTDVFADTAALEMSRALLDIVESWRPDVILRGAFEFAGCVVAERLGLPHATIGGGLFHHSRALEPLIQDQLAYLRSVHQLAPYPALDMLYPHLYIAQVPPSYEFPDVPLPPSYRAVRPTFDSAPGETLPAWIERLPDRPTVHATLGTVFNRAPEIYRIILEGLRDEPINLVLAVGRDQDPAQFGPQPDNVYIERYLPHTLLLPHCDAVIGHGGANTTLQTLSHGLPLVTIPLSAEQPFHAARCADLGVGLVLRQPGAAPLHLDAANPELSPDTLREAVRELLHNPSFREKARGIQREIAALPEPAQAGPWVEELVEQAPGKDGSR